MQASSHQATTLTTLTPLQPVVTSNASQDYSVVDASTGVTIPGVLSSRPNGATSQEEPTANTDSQEPHRYDQEVHLQHS